MESERWFKPSKLVSFQGAKGLPSSLCFLGQGFAHHVQLCVQGAALRSHTMSLGLELGAQATSYDGRQAQEEPGAGGKISRGTEFAEGIPKGHLACVCGGFSFESKCFFLFLRPEV